MLVRDRDGHRRRGISMRRQGSATPVGGDCGTCGALSQTLFVRSGTSRYWLQGTENGRIEEPYPTRDANRGRTGPLEEAYLWQVSMSQNANIWDHCLEQASLTDVGLRRPTNQDSKAIVLASGQEKWSQRGHLFIVADGMGAHAAGELASKLAIDMVPLTYHKLKDRAPPQALRAAIEDANNQIYHRGEASGDFRGMGTTLSSLAILPQGALVAHVGDSRAYRLRSNRLEQLTFDHSLVWEIRAAEKIPEDEVPEYIPKNVITRSLGPNPSVQVDLEGPFPIEVGDTFLLCSDGLSGPVADDEIGKIVGSMSADEAVRALVDLANLRGGPDNITVIVVRVTAPQTARGAAARPALAASSAAGHSVHPVVWSLLGLLTLAAAGLATAGYAMGAVAYTVGAVASGIGAVLAGVVALVQGYGRGEPTYQFDGRPLGKGPYASFDCAADAGFVGRLADIIQQLRDLAAREGWTVDWGGFDALADQAAAASETSDCVRAVRKYCLAISFFVSELKGPHPSNSPGDAAAPGPR